MLPVKKTPHLKKLKEAEIVQLLADWADKYPPAMEEAVTETIFSSLSAYDGSGWPLNAECLRRMDKRSLVGQTYEYLEDALDDLAIFHPEGYVAICDFYLHPDAGHSDVEFARSKARMGYLGSKRKVSLHDKAISHMADFLSDVDLWVRWGEKVVKLGYRSVDERHAELVRIYARFIKDGYTNAKALRHAALKMDIHQESARRIINMRMDSAEDED